MMDLNLPDFDYTDHRNTGIFIPVKKMLLPESLHAIPAFFLTHFFYQGVFRYEKF